MKRAAFEHAIRAAGAILGVREVIIIGSQALHASVEGDLPEEATRSVEVDLQGRRGTTEGSGVLPGSRRGPARPGECAARAPCRDGRIGRSGPGARRGVGSGVKLLFATLAREWEGG